MSSVETPNSDFDTLTSIFDLAADRVTKAKNTYDLNLQVKTSKGTAYINKYKNGNIAVQFASMQTETTEFLVKKGGETLLLPGEKQYKGSSTEQPMTTLSDILVEVEAALGKAVHE